MSRNVVYRIGNIGVWYTDGEVHFEIIEDCRRLETYLNARYDMPYFLQVLFNIYRFFLSDYMKDLHEKRKELNEMLTTVIEKINETEKKHDIEYVKELKKKVDDLNKRIDRINEVEKVVKKLMGELVRLREYIATFKELSDRVWFGRG